MRYKILLISFMFISVIFCLGITYSIFHSDSNLQSIDQGIAKFIFNTEKTDLIQLPIIDLNPGDDKNYEFAVSNTSSSTSSDVTIEYQITIKTYHLIPLTIELFNSDEQTVINCDESNTRNNQNELVCKSDVITMNYSSMVLDNYELKIKFPDTYSDISYSDLVDYINIEINSWQKIDS